MELRFDQPISEDAIRNALASLPGEKTVQRYGDAADNKVLIRLPQVLEVEENLVVVKRQVEALRRQQAKPNCK